MQIHADPHPKHCDQILAKLAAATPPSSKMPMCEIFKSLDFRYFYRKAFLLCKTHENPSDRKSHTSPYQENYSEKGGGPPTGPYNFCKTLKEILRCSDFALSSMSNIFCAST
jgi:hypothetical protein